MQALFVGMCLLAAVLPGTWAKRYGLLGSHCQVLTGMAASDEQK